MIPLWTGSINTWELDETGHMNVRIYVEKAMEGLGAFAADIGLPDAFKDRAISTLIPAEHHIRFINEVHAGRPLKMTGCVLSFDEDSVWLYQDIRHGDGRPAAAFRTRLVHSVAPTGKAFKWGEATLKRLEALIDTPPDDTKPRGIDLDHVPRPTEEATLEQVHSVQAPEIGRGMVRPQHCDSHGRIRPAWFMGRISDSVPNLLHQWRKDVAASAEGDVETGAAVLEYRLIYRKWPQSGDLFVAHSALANVAENTHSLVHWVLDPVSGEAWMTSEAVGVTFDLKARKILPTPKKQMAALEKIAPRGLTI